MPASPYTPVRKAATMHTTTPYKTAVQRLSIGRMLSVAGGEVAFVALMALVFGGPIRPSGARRRWSP